MIVKIQILSDDGETVVLEHLGNAFCAIGQEFVPGCPVTQNGRKLLGFCYLPVPPPRDFGEPASWRRLAEEHFGYGPEDSAHPHQASRMT